MNKTEQDFFGIYQDELRGFVQYKRALGCEYGWRKIYSLLELNQFLDSCQCDKVILTREMADSFVQKKNGKSSQTIHNSECVIRQFGLYLRNKGYPDIFVRPESHIRVTTDFVPYIFTTDEVRRIFDAADNLGAIPQSPHYKIFYQTLLRTLYCTGMRINEALTLKVEDVDFNSNLFIVLNSKGNVSRLVPFDDSLKEWLINYRSETSRRQDTYFFESPRKGKRSSIAVNTFFRKTILPAAGIKRKADNTGPRIHDLRHTFACHSLDKMVHEGIDPFCGLPYLSTYLGHKGIESTEKYLRLTADHFEKIIEAGHYIYEDIERDNA